MPLDCCLVLAYCRPGFESECAQELQTQAADAGIAGHVRTQRDSGAVEFVAADAAQELAPLLDWRAQIFSRQRLAVFAHFPHLPRGDRLTPLLEVLRARGERFAEVWVEAPETEAGKTLARMCASLENALRAALRREHLLDPRAPRRLHLFAANETSFHLAAGAIAHAAPWPQGIARLKFPAEAPSRSTLKLDEAFLVLLDADERTRWLQPRMTAVDLGAAPGGWTYQLVRRGLRVTAIDNGPMAPALMASGLVTHLREDGFRYRPKKPVDWLVCDMVEQPRRVAERITAWLAEGWCRHAIFNLKLPMKKRWAEVQTCLAVLQDSLAAAGGSLHWRGKQLYHDREEVTIYARAGGGAGGPR